jgi:hypothetical protein
VRLERDDTGYKRTEQSEKGKAKSTSYVSSSPNEMNARK